jgi:hypothetical protein
MRAYATICIICTWMSAHVCACVRACMYLCVCIQICNASIPSRSATATQRSPAAAENSDRPPHPSSPFAFTSAPCVSSASATVAACPYSAEKWSGVHLWWNALAKHGNWSRWCVQHVRVGVWVCADGGGGVTVCLHLCDCVPVRACVVER